MWFQTERFWGFRPAVCFYVFYFLCMTKKIELNENCSQKLHQV